MQRVCAARTLRPAVAVPSRAYHERVVDHYNNPRNVGTLDKSRTNVGTGLVGAPACGDVMRFGGCGRGAARFYFFAAALRWAAAGALTVAAGCRLRWTPTASSPMPSSRCCGRRGAAGRWCSLGADVWMRVGHCVFVAGHRVDQGQDAGGERGHQEHAHCAGTHWAFFPPLPTLTVRSICRCHL